MLFPLSADGWSHFIAESERAWDSWIKKSNTTFRFKKVLCNKSLTAVLLLMMMTLVIGSGLSPFCNNVFNRNEDTATYMERLRRENLLYQEAQAQRKPMTVLVSDDRQIMKISFWGYSECAKVYFPVWSEENEQDDIVWYSAKRVETDNCWTCDIDLSRHQPAGNINIHVYGSYDDNTDDIVFLNGTIFYVENAA